MAAEIIDRGRYKRGDTILIGGEPYHVIKRSWFTDKDGFYTYTVEGVVVTDAFVNWLLDPVCDRTDSVGRLNAEDIPKLLQEFNATPCESSDRASTAQGIVEGGSE